MVTHRIWFAGTATSGPMSVDVEAYDNPRCVSIAQLLWDTLQLAGYHMLNARP